MQDLLVTSPHPRLTTGAVDVELEVATGSALHYTCAVSKFKVQSSYSTTHRVLA